MRVSPIRFTVLLAALAAGCGPGSTPNPSSDLSIVGSRVDMTRPGENSDLAGSDLSGVDLSGGGDMAMAQVGNDMTIPGCKSNADCPMGNCDPNSGLCVKCAADGDCKDPMNSRCDNSVGKCVPCLPMNDNCAKGTFCTQSNGLYTCSPGCQSDNDCSNRDGGGMGADKSICCNHICIDASGDTANCGACGKTCVMGQGCCAGACSDPTTDVNNCGGCGKGCAGTNAQVACTNSMCVLSSCTQGFADCDKNPANGCEVNLNTDPMNCTACGMACSVAHGTAGCNMACTVAACDPGFADCDKMYNTGCEVNTAVDANNCNACGAICGMVTNGTPGCVMSKCGVGSCSGAFQDCDKMPGNGCEVDTSADPANCGMCGKACVAPANASAACSGGACGIGTCNKGFADCNMKAMDGCEVNTGADTANCGACGKQCGAVANASAACTNGLCGIGKCNAGFADCNQNPGDGCEVNINGDINNCGGCGMKCPTAPNTAPSCNNGMCGFTACMAPLKHCSQNPLDGCETNLSNDVGNCGACNAVCPNVFNGIRACTNSVCGIGSCNQNYADCDMNPANGCEIQTSNDASNCGKCGNKCALANAQNSCVSGACAIGMCNPPFNDCNKNPMDGCESNSTSDINNCGACGTQCVVANGVGACANSACGIGSCNAPFADCNKSYKDGCEVNTSNDVNNCGACAVKCPAIANGVADCAGSKCGIASCNAPYADCDNNPANGCETKTDSDPKNCGGCGVVCQSGQCNNGSCGGSVLVISAMASQANDNDVVSKLKATGAFSTVDLFDASSATPSVAQMQKYSSVLVSSNTTFKDINALGDNLATYFDGGGHVVLAQFAFAQAPYAIGGRWGNIANGYMLMNPTGYTSSAEPNAITIVDPSSPLVAGVARLTAQSGFKGTGALVNNAVVVAKWGSGAPLIIRGVKGARALVEVNMFPPSAGAVAGYWVGDGAIIMKNALLYDGWCHSIVGKGGATCASGKTQFCDPNSAISATSAAQSSAACAACYGKSCFDETADCAGHGWGPNPLGKYVCGDAYFGYTAGCSGPSGRIWSICSSNTTYGRWAP